MERILCFSDSEVLKDGLRSMTGATLIGAETSEELAKLAVENPELTCAVVHIPEANEFWAGFLRSMSSTLPVLKLLVVVEEGSLAEIGGDSEIIQGSASDPELPGRLAEKIRSAGAREKRAHHRFDWPLTGTLNVGGEPKAYNVREISASGAFLECGEGSPQAGTRGTLLVRFKDFSVLTDCTTLRMRGETDKLPAGFGVRFTDLTEWSRKVIDRIISDELVRQLLNPGHAPAAPTIEELPLTAYDRD